MDFKTAIRVKECCIDMDTGKPLSHSEIYGRMIDKLGGVDAVWKYVPFDLEEVQKALKCDQNLNNLPLSVWDYAAETIAPLLIRNRITCFSLAERVCTLKECARRKAAG